MRTSWDGGAPIRAESDPGMREAVRLHDQSEAGTQYGELGDGSTPDDPSEIAFRLYTATGDTTLTNV